MEEENKKTENEETKEKVGESKDTGKGDKSKTPQVTLDALAAVERMEKANERTAELLRLQQDLVARKALGGDIDTGKTEEKKEETPLEYTEKVMSGGLNKKDDKN